MLIALCRLSFTNGGKERAHAILVNDASSRRARRLGIDYFWFDEDDVTAKLGANPPRFLERPELFSLVFRQNDVFVFRVN